MTHLFSMIVVLLTLQLLLSYVMGKSFDNQIQSVGSDGTVIWGTNEWESLARKTFNAGDFNGDSIEDIGVQKGVSGQIYVCVIFGRDDWYETYDQFDDVHPVCYGPQVSFMTDFAVADINNDGLSDITVNPTTTETFIIYGNSTVSGPVYIDPLTMTHGRQRMLSTQTTYKHGVHGVGDMNGDNIDEMVFYYSSLFTTYVLFGKDGGWDESKDLYLTEHRANVTTLEIEYIQAFIPEMASGDLDNDGLHDLILSARGATGLAGEQNAGRIVILYGTAEGYPNSTTVQLLNPELTPGLRHTIIASKFTMDPWLESFQFVDDIGIFGADIMVGDFNGDGHMDVGVNRDFTENHCQGYLFFGSENGTFSNNETRGVYVAEALVDTRIIPGIVDEETGSGCFNSFFNAGDVNGDGKDDVFLGQPSVAMDFARMSSVSILLGRDEWDEFTTVHSRKDPNIYYIEEVSQVDLNFGYSHFSFESSAGRYDSSGNVTLVMPNSRSNDVTNEIRYAGSLYVLKPSDLWGTLTACPPLTLYATESDCSEGERHPIGTTCHLACPDGFVPRNDTWVEPWPYVNSSIYWPALPRRLLNHENNGLGSVECLANGQWSYAPSLGSCVNDRQVELVPHRDYSTKFTSLVNGTGWGFPLYFLQNETLDWAFPLITQEFQWPLETDYYHELIVATTYSNKTILDVRFLEVHDDSTWSGIKADFSGGQLSSDSAMPGESMAVEFDGDPTLNEYVRALPRNNQGGTEWGVIDVMGYYDNVLASSYPVHLIIRYIGPSHDYGHFGKNLAVGDINGDGKEDIVTGAYDSINDISSVYVIYGFDARNTSEWHAVASILQFAESLSNTADCTYNCGAIIRHRGANTGQGSKMGRNALATGDVNGDGYVDILMSGYESAALMLGSANLGTEIITNSTAGFTTFYLQNMNAHNEDRFDSFVGFVGDVDNDSFGDFIITEPIDTRTYYGLQVAHKAYLIFSHAGPYATSIDLDNASNNEAGGFTFISLYSHDIPTRWYMPIEYGYNVHVQLGRDIDAADFNMDGYSDFLITDPFAGQTGGRAWLVYGRERADFPRHAPLEDLARVVIKGEDSSNWFGYFKNTINVIPDVNGDGLEDLSIYEHGKSSTYVLTDFRFCDTKSLLELMNGYATCDGEGAFPGVICQLYCADGYVAYATEIVCEPTGEWTVPALCEPRGCTLEPCMNGICVQDAVNPDNYTCDCTDTGFEGDHCQSDVDDCASSPCLNGGFCVDNGTNAFYCECSGTGFDGDVCDTDIDDCMVWEWVAVPAGPASSSESFASSAAASSASDTGAMSSTAATSAPASSVATSVPTASSTATSSPVATSSGVTRRLLQVTSSSSSSSSSTGATTGIPTSSPTSSAATSSPLASSSSPVSSGVTSSPGSDLIYMLMPVCQNGAQCTDTGPNNYTCACTVGYTGLNCDEDADMCVDSTACGAGMCVNEGAGEISCDCVGTGYEGAACESLVDTCVSMPCENGDICSTIGPNVFECTPSGDPGDPLCDDITCYSPYPNCVEGVCVGWVNPCEPNPCNGSAVCIVAEGQSAYACYSAVPDCTLECQNAGTCVTDTVCACPFGIIGDTCQTNPDDCFADACVEGSTCVDGLNDFTCDCPNMTLGADCSTAFVDCETTNPCYNDGVCAYREGEVDYWCDCTDTGYSGSQCGAFGETAESSQEAPWLRDGNDGTETKDGNPGGMDPVLMYIIIGVAVAAVAGFGYMQMQKKASKIVPAGSATAGDGGAAASSSKYKKRSKASSSDESSDESPSESSEPESSSSEEEVRRKRSKKKRRR